MKESERAAFAQKLIIMKKADEERRRQEKLKEDEKNQRKRKALEDAGLPLDKFHDSIKSMNEALLCGPICRKEREITRLKGVYDRSQINITTAPEELRLAEKNYYVFAKGENYYGNMVKTRYDKEAEDMRKSSTKKHEEYLKELSTLINDYEAETIYSNKMHDLLKIYLTENEQLKKKIESLIAIIETSDRKTYYEDEQISTLNSVYKFFFVLYWILFVVYCAIVLILKKQFKNWKEWAIILVLGLIPNIFIPSILYIVRKIINIVSDFWRKKGLKNIYTSITD